MVHSLFLLQQFNTKIPGKIRAPELKVELFNLYLQYSGKHFFHLINLLGYSCITNTASDAKPDDVDCVKKHLNYHHHSTWSATQSHFPEP